MTGDAGVRDRDSPKQRRFKVIWRRDRVHIARFVTDLFRDAGIVGDDESERTRCAASRCDHREGRADTSMRNERDQFFRRNETEGGTGRAKEDRRDAL